MFMEDHAVKIKKKSITKRVTNFAAHSVFMLSISIYLTIIILGLIK